MKAVSDNGTAARAMALLDQLKELAVAGDIPALRNSWPTSSANPPWPAERQGSERTVKGMVQSELGPFALRTFDQTPDGWDELLVADSAVDFFHTRQWSAAACAHYPNLEPVWLVAETKRPAGGRNSAVEAARPAIGSGPRSSSLESNLEGTSGGP